MALKSYHFDMGNSNEGPVGFCVEVHASSKKEAVELVRSFVESVEDGLNMNPSDMDAGIQYGQVYFNAEAITEKDIDEVKTVEE